MSSTDPVLPETLEGVIAWLETQDPTITYNPGSCHNCVLCALLKDLGARNPEVNYNYYGYSPKFSYKTMSPILRTLQLKWNSLRNKRTGPFSITNEQALLVARTLLNV